MIRNTPNNIEFIRANVYLRDAADAAVVAYWIDNTYTRENRINEIVIKLRQAAEICGFALVPIAEEAFPPPAVYDEHDAPYTGQAEDMATGSAPPVPPQTEDKPE